jgi:hypothetical protein
MATTKSTVKKLDAGGIINTMILLEREPDRVKKEVVGTVTTIHKISGKSLTSLRRSCSLPNLPEELVALVEGRLPEAPKKKPVLA